MVLAGTAGVHSLPDELLIRVLSLVLPEVQTCQDRMTRDVPLWLLLVCKRWYTLLCGPSTLFASFCVEFRGNYAASNSAAMRVLLARLRGATALSIQAFVAQPCIFDAMFARLLCDLGSLPVLESLHIALLPSDLTLEQQLGMRRIAQLASLRSLHLEHLKYRELQLLQGYSALSCLTCLRLELYDRARPVLHTMVLPSFILQLQRLQSLALVDHNQIAGYSFSLPKVKPMAGLLVLLMY